MVSITLVIQDMSQLTLHYGQRQAKVITSMVGNIISGQVTGESASMLSERFGKILQDKASISINSNDTSLNRSKQLDHAIPVSTISSLSSGEFVEVVADNPDQRIQQKMFHAEFKHDLKSLSTYKKDNKFPYIETVNAKIAKNVYLKNKAETKKIILEKIGELTNNPEKRPLILRDKIGNM